MTGAIKILELINTMLYNVNRESIFIILSHPRSGTTYLNNYILPSHPKVHCYDELFFLSETTRKYLKKIGLSTRFDFPFNVFTKFFSSEYSVYRYIQAHHLKAKQYSGKNIIGFKLFPNQLKPHEIEYLFIKKKIPVIILRRKNMIQAAISYQIAKITGQWAYHSKKDFGEIVIDPSTIEDYFRKFADFLDHYEKLLSEYNIQYHKCYYENLFTLDTINKIFDFLSVEHIHKIPEGDKKLNTPDRYKKIKNLNEIQNIFCNEKNGFLFI